MYISKQVSTTADPSNRTFPQTGFCLHLRLIAVRIEGRGGSLPEEKNYRHPSFLGPKGPPDKNGTAGHNTRSIG